MATSSHTVVADGHAAKSPSAARQRSLPVQFLLGGGSTSLACLFTNPIEVVKTRMQLQGELSASLHHRPYKNVFQAFYSIAKHEGIAGVQRGLLPAMIYQFVMNGVRLGSYEPIKRQFGGFDSHSSGSSFFISTVGAGALAGVLGASVASPLYLMKTRLQAISSHASHSVGHQHQMDGMWHGFVTVFKSEGIRGLYRGVTASQARVAVGSAIQLSTYDSSKKLVMSLGMKDGPPAHLTASVLSGLCVTIGMNPFDVVSTRVSNQKVGADGHGVLYRGPVDCLQKTFRSEGLRGLYKGFFAHYLRLGPHTILTFLIWEQLKELATQLGV